MKNLRSLDLVEKPYTGPITHSRTKGATTQDVDVIVKANKIDGATF